MDMLQIGKALSVLGKTAGSRIVEQARQSAITIPPELTDLDAHPSTEQIVATLRASRHRACRASLLADSARDCRVRGGSSPGGSTQSASHPDVACACMASMSAAACRKC